MAAHRFLSLLAFSATFLVLSFPHALASGLARRLLLSTNEAQQFLDAHNRIRANAGLPLLQWDKDVANFAISWAKQRHGDCALQHSDTNYGENIFWGGGSSWQPADAVAAWAAEAKYYDLRTNTCQPGNDCTHYTQIVWQESRKLGCARIICSCGDTFITCNYDPHGNVLGEKPY